MKGLPYFKFMTDDWLGGLICTHDMETQGIFINLCARLWKAGGYLEEDIPKLARMLHTENQLLTNCLILLKQDGLVCLSNDNLLSVKFILEQLGERQSLSVKRSIAGSKGGKANAKQKVTNCLQPEPEPKTEPKPKIKNEKEELLKGFLLKLYNRRESTEWSDKETKLLKKIAKRINLQDEMNIIEKAREGGWKYGRTSISILLNNWTDEVDKSQNFTGSNGGQLFMQYHENGNPMFNERGDAIGPYGEVI